MTQGHFIEFNLVALGLWFDGPKEWNKHRILGQKFSLEIQTPKIIGAVLRTKTLISADFFPKKLRNYSGVYSNENGLFSPPILSLLPLFFGGRKEAVLI